MRKIWAETKKDFNILLRDKNAFLLLMVMPVILIFILGSVFGSLWGSAPEKTPVVVVDMDKGEMADVLRNDVLGKAPVSEIVEVQYAGTLEEGKNGVAKGSFAGCLVIPGGFSDKVLRGQEAQLSLITDPGRPIGSTIIKEIAQRFTQGISQVQVGANVVVNTFAEKGLIEPNAVPAFAGQVVGILRSAEKRPLIETKTTFVAASQEKAKGTGGEAVVKAMDYYAMGMGIMYALFTAMTTSGSILEEKTNKTWTRMLVTPTREWMILSGKLLYMILAGSLQLTILALFSKYVFGANWGQSIIGFVLVTIGVVTATSGLLLAMASMASSAEAQSAVAVPVTLILSFLGGAMWPVYVMPKWLDAVSNLSPVRWGLRAFINLSQGSPLSEILPQVALLLSFGAVFLTLGTIMLSRRVMRA